MLVEGTRYSVLRAVAALLNTTALAAVEEVFEACDRTWRGIGPIADSGWRLRDGYSGFDAERRFDLWRGAAEEPHGCRSGEVLLGLIKPFECANFGTACTPRTPIGATMVSSEGACAAYHRYQPVGDARSSGHG